MIRVVLLSSRKPLIGRDTDEFVIDFGRREIWRQRQCLSLAQTPFRYLAAVLSAAGNVVTYDSLTDAIWNDSEDGGSLDPRNFLCVLRRAYRPRLARLGAEIGVRDRWGHFLIAHPVQAFAMAA